MEFVQTNGRDRNAENWLLVYDVFVISILYNCKIFIYLFFYFVYFNDLFCILTIIKQIFEGQKK